MMSLTSLLVLLDADAHCAARTRLAASYAAAHGCQLIGIAPTGVPELVAGLGGAMHFNDEAALAREQAIGRADGLASQFRHHCHARGLAWVETEVCEGERGAVLLNRAHVADVTVIGQADPASASFREDHRFVEQMLMKNPRPTLLIPHGGGFEHFGANVLIAWDGSRGCTRAVADALPVLRHASTVRLLVLRRDSDPGVGSIRHSLAGLDRWLQWHGVNPTIDVETTARRIGEALLESAAASRADLIVMGTYGHSRWTERLLGGTTRQALAHSPIPLFLAH